LRTGGYVIDFWGAGFDIADRMGLLPQLKCQGYAVREVRIVNRNGKRVSGFPADAFVQATDGRYVSLARGDLAAMIFGQIEGRVETIFGDSVARIEQSEACVRVTFESGSERDFDLVVGADGLHSRIRELVFGPESEFEKYLGYKAAAFAVNGYRPRDELTYVMYTEVSQQVGRFAMRGDRTMFLFIFADENPSGTDDLPAQKAMLRKRFGNSGWECAQILDALDRAPDLYFDRISQIRMDANRGLWTRNRVALTGDAAFCVSLLAGQGSSLAMVAAYILASELHRAKRQLRTGVRALPESICALYRSQAESSFAVCRILCAEIGVLPVYSQPSLQTPVLSLGSRHRDEPRPRRQNRIARIRVSRQPSRSSDVWPLRPYRRCV
jgi:2-polyprenyl-6-methoxyphenol hydroxylase-like FAD-dependent oxidoreductase